jgi:hypothetical protein
LHFGAVKFCLPVSFARSRLATIAFVVAIVALMRSAAAQAVTCTDPRRVNLLELARRSVIVLTG